MMTNPNFCARLNFVGKAVVGFDGGAGYGGVRQYGEKTGEPKRFPSE